MPAMTIRNLPEDTHRAIKRRAKRLGTSAEAEVRTLLVEAMRTETEMGVGDEIAAFGRRFGGIELEIKRDQSLAGSVLFK